MRSVYVAMLLFVFATAWESARADGLIYKLPEDGVSVTYDMEISASADGEDRSRKGTLTISSVGTTRIGQEPCRWIEFKTVVVDGDLRRHAIAKLLIPEKHLQQGHAPGEHLIRGWVKDGESKTLEIKDLKDPVAGGVLLYVAGPAKRATDLDYETVETGLGKLRCRGTAGDVQFGQFTVSVKAHCETRLSDKAPFGVAASIWKFERTRDGQVAEAGTITLTAAEVRTDAASDLPNSN